MSPLTFRNPAKLLTYVPHVATAIPVTAESMNYASVVFAGFSFIAGLWYVVNARKHYHGPTLSTVRVGDSTEIVEEYPSSEKA